MLLTNSNLIPSILIRTLTTLVFMANLMGWKSLPLTAGLTVLMMPLLAKLTQRHHQLNEESSKQRRETSTVINEALLAIRQIKLSASEDKWMDRFLGSREKELNMRHKRAVAVFIQNLVHSVSMAVLGGVPLYMAARRGERLTAAIAFTFLGLFEALQAQVSSFSFEMSYVMEGWAAMQRLQHHFDAPEAERLSGTAADDVSMEMATMAWNRKSDNIFRLEGTLEVPSGQLSIISGDTASGKSLLLSAIAGEAALLSGQVSGPTPHQIYLGEPYDPEHQSQSLAIVTQNPWMENNTIRNNVLFGLPFDKERYDLAIHCCALEKDLEMLKDGDATVIGTKGISLSGGQRWRIALARALFSHARILLLDDILSAVDAEVREWLVDKALFGPLAKDRTRILATHHASHCASRAALVLQLENGKVSQAKKSNISLQPTDTTTKAKPAQSEPQPEQSPEKPQRKEIPEARFDTYLTYYKAAGGLKSVLMVLLLLSLATTLSYARTSWLREWTRHYGRQEVSVYSASDATYYGGLYMLLSIAFSVVDSARAFLADHFGLGASRPLVARALAGTFLSPLRWLEHVSKGDILNRFTSDTHKADQGVPENIIDAIATSTSLAAILYTRYVSRACERSVLTH